MTAPKVVQAIGPVWEVTLYTAISCQAGDLLAHNGTGWVLADPSTPLTLSAKAVALNAAGPAEKVLVCKEVMIEDVDLNAYTQNARQYLGNTAGSISETAPSTDGDLIQVVGVAVTTNLIHVLIEPPHLEYAYLARDDYDGTNEAGAGLADAGWAGAQVDGAEAAMVQPFRVPENCIGLVEARLAMNSIAATGGDLDVDVVGAYAGASNVQDLGTSFDAGDWEQTDADNIIYTCDISTVLDEGLFTPGRIFQVLFDSDAPGAGAYTFLGCYLTYLCV